MATMTQPEVKPTSRRALLAGALGGLGALAASAIGRPTKTAATDGQPLVVGQSNSATNTTALSNTTDVDPVFQATSVSGIALNGQSSTSFGVLAASDNFIGLRGYGGTLAHAGVQGWGSVDATGVHGLSGAGSFEPPLKTGVYGYAAQDSSAKGVYGESPAGHGIHGKSTGGWAGYFAGRVYTSRYHEMQEISDPPAPGVNKARLFVRDNGNGKTQLCVRFNTGVVRVIETQA